MISFVPYVKRMFNSMNQYNKDMNNVKIMDGKIYIIIFVVIVMNIFVTVF
jgi:hypothetical protein